MVCLVASGPSPNLLGRKVLIDPWLTLDDLFNSVCWALAYMFILPFLAATWFKSIRV